MVGGSRVHEVSPHEILGLDESASVDDIRRAFRALALQYHPDVRGDDPDAAKQFHLIREAYDMLRGHRPALAPEPEPTAENAHEQSAALHAAVRLGHTARVRDLIAQGANVEARDAEGRSPLAIALSTGNADIAQALLDGDADANARGVGETFFLHFAAQERRPDLVRLLVQHGANAAATDDSGATAMHVACRTGDTAVVREMLRARGAAESFVARDNLGQAPIHLALAGDSFETLELVLGAGADPSAPGASGGTPLHTVAARGDADAVRLLLQHRASVTARDAQGRTPLHMAAAFDAEEVLELLVAGGARTDDRDATGRTPLHAAVSDRCPGTTRRLLAHEASVEARDGSGSTALDIARARGAGSEIESLLLAHSAAADPAPTPRRKGPLSRFLRRPL